MLPEKIQPTTYVFAEYANSSPWIAAHIGQFVGEIIIFAGGFVALFRLLVQSQSMTVSILAWIGFTTAIITASTLSILQAVDGIALKRAVDSWVIAPAGEKMTAFRVAEGIRWIEVGINGIYRILQGTVVIVFSVAFILSTVVRRYTRCTEYYSQAGYAASIIDMNRNVSN